MSKKSKSITTKKSNAGHFNAELLLESLREHRAILEGQKKVTLRTWTISTPTPVKPFKPKEIAAIRTHMNLSQPVFAQMLNVPVATARSWESGRRKPTGAALRLLQLVKKSPELVFKAAA